MTEAKQKPAEHKPEPQPPEAKPHKPAPAMAATIIPLAGPHIHVSGVVKVEGTSLSVTFTREGAPPVAVLLKTIKGYSVTIG